MTTSVSISISWSLLILVRQFNLDFLSIRAIFPVMNSLTTLSPAQLRKAANIQEKIQKLQKKLNQILGGQVSAPVESTEAPKARRKRGRRKMSAAAKAKMARLMKARWAKAKKAGKSKL